MAEGYGRNSTQDYIRFLRIANGSLFELQTQLEIARNLKFLSEESFSLLFELSREIERMLSSLIRKINPD
jgi:four helix bundle protein